MNASSESGLWATVISRTSAAVLVVCSVSDTAVILLWTPARPRRCAVPSGLLIYSVCTPAVPCRAFTCCRLAARGEQNQSSSPPTTLLSPGRGSRCTASFTPSGLPDRPKLVPTACWGGFILTPLPGCIDDNDLAVFSQ